MAKNNRNRPLPRKQTGGVFKQLTLVFFSFLCGYLSSSLFNLTQVADWMKTNLLAKQMVLPTKVAQQAMPRPKPKFEFYTLLSNERAQGSVSPTTIANNSSKSAATVATAVVADQTKLKSQAQTIKLKPSVPVSEPAPSVKEIAQAITRTSTNKNAYMLQIGSFKSKSVAARLKASLALKGFHVTVAEINQRGTSWYRVVLGPFPDRVRAEQAQDSVARSQHIRGMIRKMEA